MNEVPMKLGYDASPVRGHRTGVEHYTVRLLEALRALDDVEVVAFSDHELSDCPDVVVRPSRLPLSLWRQFVLPRLVREAGCTSFHSPVTALSVRLRVPVTAMLHDFSWQVVSHCYPIKAWLKQWVWFRVAARRAAYLIAVSETTRRDAVERYPHLADRIVAVHSGPVAAHLPSADEAKQREMRKRFGLAGRFVLAVGRVERRKNPAFVVRSFAQCVAGGHFDDVQLLFAGPPGNEYEAALSTARELSITDRVVFCDHLGGELAQLYAAAEALVYMSLDEGFGHPPFEAISLGTPVIASDVPAIREVLGDGGLLVSLDEPDALVMAMRRVLSEPGLRAELLARGRERLQQFSWQATAEAVVALHRGLT
jgi:glycosyltransferase involved in cell wall biosynthesis